MDRRKFPASSVSLEMSGEIRRLEEKIAKLSAEVESIRRRFPEEDASPVERALKERGLRVFRRNPQERLFFPAGLSPHEKTLFYERMKRYSFRLVVRDIIKRGGRFSAEDLTHYCSAGAARRHCDFLASIGALRAEGEGFYRAAVPSIDSFGPALEWFVAEIFKREFASAALHGVRLKRTAHGGDYDVIAHWSGRLVYVEVKSSPPRGVEPAEISAFFSRTDDLLPEAAILFNDTRLRMKDKLVVMFEEELARRGAKSSGKALPVKRLVEELFHVGHRVFIVNSRKDVAENFRICLTDYLRHGGSPCLSPP